MVKTQVKPSVPGPLELVYRGLTSLPVAIGVMLVLAGLAALGTLIPQEHLAQPSPGMTMEQMYLARFGPERYRIISTLGLTHVYFTWYFFVLLVWLSVSALVCSLRRFYHTVQLWRQPLAQDAELARGDSSQAIVLRSPEEETAARIVKKLTTQRLRVHRGQVGAATLVYADRGLIRSWALVLLHVSVVVLLFGAIYGKTLGVEGRVELADGEERELVLDVSSNKHPWVRPLLANLPLRAYQLVQERFRIDYDYSLQLPRMIAEQVTPELQEYYRYFVKDFVSELSVTQGDRTVSREVKVNHPLLFGALRLYQSSYLQTGHLRVVIGDQYREYELVPERWTFFTADRCYLETEWGWAELTADGALIPTPDVDPPATAFLFEPVKAGDLYRGGEKQGSLEPLTIVHIAGLAPDELHSQLLSPTKAFSFNIAGQSAELALSPRVDNLSVFSYKTDPGLTVLYLGWLAMIIGIAIALYIPYSYLQLRLEDGRAFIKARGPIFKAGGALMHRLHDILR